VPPIALRVQLPVGFGGFHVGVLGYPVWPGSFVLTFDCGALTSQLARDWAARVGREIRAWAGRVDLAVLSHTDFDHVCGIEALARTAHIDTLMLPNLSLRFRAAQAAAYAHQGTPRWYATFLRDPVGWAAEMGVGRVVLVGGPAERQPVEGDAGPEGPPEEGAGAATPTLTLGRTARPIGGRATEIASGDPLTVTVAHPNARWHLVPIVAPPRDRQALEGAVNKVLNGASYATVFDGLGQRATSSLRNKLAQVYRRHWGSTNRSSIILIVAPFQGEGGWVCTGDADLSSSETRRLVRTYGAAFLPRVDAIQVPHHGSPKNFDTHAAGDLLALTRKPSLRWVISSGRNKWNYPSASVRAACTAHGSIFETTPSSAWKDVRCF
jgi:hypothetical protein